MTIDDITNSRLRARLREVSREMMSKTGMPVSQVHATPAALELVRQGQSGKAVSDSLFCVPKEIDE